jgi:hypothetical protein
VGRLAEPMTYDATSDTYVRRRSTPRGGSATRRHSSTSSGCASSGPTTCRTARTCVTRQAAGR